MSKRVRRPLVSLAMFLVVVSAAIVVYENRDWLKTEKTMVILDQEVRERIEDKIFAAMESDPCFLGLKGHLNWRPNEQRYRLDIEVEEGAVCEPRARALCEAVAHLIEEDSDIVATVVAFDIGGREIARIVL